MTQNEIKSVIEKQREFFNTGKTLDVKFRTDALKRLKKAIEENTDEINSAIKKDLGKSDLESYMCEVGLTLSEISYMLKHIKGFSKDKRFCLPWHSFRRKAMLKACLTVCAL